MLHTILGAGGSVGNALAEELLKDGLKVRLVSRSGFALNGTEVFKADITDPDQCSEAVRGSDFVYLCAGLPYFADVWRVLWPQIMKNCIDSCSSENARLIYLDNVYMYGRTRGQMTEKTKFNTVSRKGMVRGAIALQLEREIKKGKVNAVIARAADLYGPHAEKTSIAWIFVFDKLLRGKKPQWLGSARMPHSFTFTRDAAKGMYLLAKTDTAGDCIWHLPTFNPPLQGRHFIEIAAAETGMPPDYSVIRKWMVLAAGIYDKKILENFEMMYQFTHRYIFNSDKFNERFSYSPVSYTEGIKETIKFLNSGNKMVAGVSADPKRES